VGERLGWIDALRGYAAGVVLLFHLGPWILGTEAHLAVFRVFDLGKYAVLLFFLVSGYLIPASLERHGSLRRFWVTRLFRIYPVYLAAIAALVVTSAAVPPVLTSVRGLLGHVTMLTDLFGLRGALRPFWTLSYEMVFYLAVAGLFVLRLHRHQAVVAVGLTVAAVMPPQTVAGLMFVATMFAGAALRSSGSLLAPAVVALGLSTVVQPIVVLGVITTFATFFALRERRMPRALTALGDISYSLYLTHVIVMQMFARFLPAVAERPFLVRGVAAAVCAACAVVTARCAYTWIERPMQRLGHRLSTQRAATRTARRVNGTGSV
jgi:peptidoglycan/LPS O-acetylase OafA/YrhL